MRSLGRLRSRLSRRTRTAFAQSVETSGNGAWTNSRIQWIGAPSEEVRGPRRGPKKCSRLTGEATGRFSAAMILDFVALSPRMELTNETTQIQSAFRPLPCALPWLGWLYRA